MNTNENFEKPDAFHLAWRDPKSGISHAAGMAFYNEKYGEYFLRIDEEPSEKRYFLKPFSVEDEVTTFRMELVLKRNDGSFKKRVKVGEGVQSEQTSGNILINFGSKYKDLVLVNRK